MWKGVIAAICRRKSKLFIHEVNSLHPPPPSSILIVRIVDQRCVPKESPSSSEIQREQKRRIGLFDWFKCSGVTLNDSSVFVHILPRQYYYYLMQLNSLRFITIRFLLVDKISKRLVRHIAEEKNHASLNKMNNPTNNHNNNMNHHNNNKNNNDTHESIEKRARVMAFLHQIYLKFAQSILSSDRSKNVIIGDMYFIKQVPPLLHPITNSKV